LNIGSQPLCQTLVGLTRANTISPKAVLGRLINLTRQSVDPRYDNPNDIAMATYLFALQQTDSALARIGAEAVIGVAGAWWASKIAYVILDRSWMMNGAPITIPETSQATTSVNSPNTRDLFLVSMLGQKVRTPRPFNPTLQSMSRQQEQSYQAIATHNPTPTPLGDQG
jgi:hypothetical protein